MRNDDDDDLSTKRRQASLRLPGPRLHRPAVLVAGNLPAPRRDNVRLTQHWSVHRVLHESSVSRMSASAAGARCGVGERTARKMEEGMSDLLSRARDAEDLDCPCRDCGPICQGELIRELADEIERLRALMDRVLVLEE